MSGQGKQKPFLKRGSIEAYKASPERQNEFARLGPELQARWRSRILIGVGRVWNDASRDQMHPVLRCRNRQQRPRTLEPTWRCRQYRSRCRCAGATPVG